MKTSITLDTNCIINLLDDNSTSRTSYEPLKYIMKLVENGSLIASVTTRFPADQSTDPDKDRVKKIASMLEELPTSTIGTVARLDVSMLNGGDFYGNDEIIDINNKLIKILSPNGLDPSADTFSNRLYDIDHLIGHYQSGNGTFITDDKGILNKADALKDQLGITVMSPTIFSEYTKSTGLTSSSQT